MSVIAVLFRFKRGIQRLPDVNYFPTRIVCITVNRVIIDEPF